MIFALTLHRDKKLESKKVEAIKILRSLTDAKLKNAKEIIDWSDSYVQHIVTLDIQETELNQAISNLHNAGYALIKKPIKTNSKLAEKTNEEKDAETLLVELIIIYLKNKDYSISNELTQILLDKYK